MKHPDPLSQSSTRMQRALSKVPKGQPILFSPVTSGNSAYYQPQAHCLLLLGFFSVCVCAIVTFPLHLSTV